MKRLLTLSAVAILVFGACSNKRQTASEETQSPDGKMRYLMTDSVQNAAILNRLIELSTHKPRAME